MSPFHPNFERKETHTTQWTLNSTLLLNGLCRCVYKTWMKGAYDIPNKNPYFFMTTEPNWMGVFVEMQIISYIFIILKHIQVSSHFQKLLMLKVQLSLFGDNLYKAIYLLVILRDMPFCNKLGEKGAWCGGFLCLLYNIWQFFNPFHSKIVNHSSWLLFYITFP